MDLTYTPSSRLRVLLASLLVIAGLLILPLLLSALWIKPTAHAAENNPSSAAANSSLEDSPNILTSSMFDASDNLGKTTSSIGKSVSNGVNSTMQSFATATVESSKFVAHGASKSASLVTHSIGNSFSFVANTTGHIFGFISNPPGISSIVRPSDKIQVPVIEASARVSAATPAAQPAIQPQPQQVNPVDSAAQWPLHGTITTYFGVPHMPYQATHTGIDISDGQRSGVTPIKPYKSGRVIETVGSRSGLGNHVVVDHGGGITSVYGHMYALSVSVGQEVNKNTTLGYEGSTGASTGTHLHFEIRLNGQPVDPRKYVSGQP